MIRINLLPYRESRKKESILRQINIFLVAFFIVFVILLYYNMWLGEKIGDLNTKIKNTKIMLTRAETQAKKVDHIKKELEKLGHKIDVIKSIETNRRAPVILLENMTKMVAENTSISPSDTSADNDNKPVKRLWFNSFDASGGKVNIKGTALDNKTIADFMSRLEESKHYKNVNLKTIKQQKIDKLNLKHFEIGCVKASLKKPEKKNDVGSKPGQK
ncbi:MAG: PilN domain-containing protein [Deltaproteobacteria bacterium]|nr:PilN domain-containing protein [Deltaproteobacteria bacterium]